MLPLSFGNTITNEGSFAQLSCVVTEGDEPLTLSRSGRPSPDSQPELDACSSW